MLKLLCTTPIYLSACIFVGCGGSGHGPNQSLRTNTSRETNLATTGKVAQPPLAGMTVVIDPGHNGNDGNHPEIVNRLVNIGTKMKACETTGTATASGYSEAAYNWDVALRTVRLLRSKGARVVLTRQSNAGVGPCINERAAIGNRAHADAAVSIHADGGPTSGRGFHVILPLSTRGLTDDIAGPSRRLGLVLRDAYKRGTDLPYATYLGDGKGLTIRDDLGGLNLSDVPKVFIETGNMNSPTDAALLESSGFRQRAANAIALGIGTFLRATRN